MFNLWPPEMLKNKFLLLYVTKVVVICYSTLEKLISLYSQFSLEQNSGIHNLVGKERSRQ
jgi:hypothetical protein